MRFLILGPQLGLTVMTAVLVGSCNTSAPRQDQVVPWEGDFTFAFNDLPADTLQAEQGKTSPALDLLSIDGTMGVNDVTFRLTFATPVTLFSAGGPTGLDGFLDIDVDENTSTGVSPVVDVLGGSGDMGVDVFIRLRDSQLGILTVTDAITKVQSSASLRLNADSTVATITISRPFQMRNDDGNVTVSLVVGQGDREGTDLGPNTGHFVIHRPPVS